MSKEKDVSRDILIDILKRELLVLRAKLGISQDELSQRIGISRQTLNAIESVKRKMIWSTFLSMTLFLSIMMKQIK